MNQRWRHHVCPLASDMTFIFLLFVWVLSSHSRFFHSYGNVTITDEGLQILTYARQFFSVPHLLWHGAFVNNGRHLRGLVTLTPIAERLTVELSLPVFITSVCRDWDSNTQPSACGSNALNHCAAAAVLNFQCIQSLNTAHAHVQVSGLY